LVRVAKRWGFRNPLASLAALEELEEE